eukprot:4862690-Lingulodinium_polyedra.AAC.1
MHAAERQFSIVLGPSPRSETLERDTSKAFEVAGFGNCVMPFAQMAAAVEAALGHKAGAYK